jgi:hypothetical protein
MPQVYLLSVVSLIVTGLALSSDYLGKKSVFLAAFGRLRENRSLQISTGLITALIGVLKLIIRSPRETVAVVGDLLPAAAGIILGIILIGEALRKGPEAAEGAEKSVEKVTRAIMPYRNPVGIAGIVVGLLHFLFPRILFL